MLLAEIHGKRFPEAEGQEDWLTSAVFGHLRQIPPETFWGDLFECAQSVEEGNPSLSARLHQADIYLTSYSNLEVRFWSYFEKYGEPDLILIFSGPEGPPLIVIIEVKLDSGKSSTGNDDQLKKYLDLLDDKAALPIWTDRQDHRYLIYLTRTFAKHDIEESVQIAASGGKTGAANRIFGLAWQDVLDCAARYSDRSPLLDEVARFLRVRGFEAFRGFRKEMPLISGSYSGAFYTRQYFADGHLLLSFNLNAGGKFYGK